MTKHQKIEIRLHKEIRKLERDKFILESEVKNLIQKNKHLSLLNKQLQEGLQEEIRKGKVSVEPKLNKNIKVPKFQLTTEGYDPSKLKNYDN